MTRTGPWRRVAPWLPAIVVTGSLLAMGPWAQAPPGNDVTPDADVARESFGLAPDAGTSPLGVAPPLGVRDRDAEAPCFHDVNGALAPAFLPLDTRTVRATHQSFDQDVDAGKRTVLLAIALGSAFGFPLTFEDVSNVTRERVEVCVLETETIVTEDDTVAALALDARVPRDALVDLAGDAFVFVAFRTVETRNVTIDRDVALAALALHDAELDLEDVLNVNTTAHSVRAVVRSTDYDRGTVLALRALAADE